MTEHTSNIADVAILVDWAKTARAADTGELERLSNGMMSAKSVDAKRRIAGEFLERLDHRHLQWLVDTAVKEQAAAQTKVTWALAIGLVTYFLPLFIGNFLGLNAQYTIGGGALFLIFALGGSVLGGAIALATIFIWVDGNEPLDPLRPNTIWLRLLVGTALGMLSAYFGKIEIKNFLFSGGQDFGGVGDVLAISPVVVGFGVRAAITLFRQLPIRAPGL